MLAAAQQDKRYGDPADIGCATKQTAILNALPANDGTADLAELQGCNSTT